MNQIVLLVLLGVIFSGILFTPLFISVNTLNNYYCFGWTGIFRVKFIFEEEELFFVKVRIFFVNFNMYPLRPKKKNKRKIKRVKRVKKKKKKGSVGFKKKRLIFRIILNVITSTKIKIFELNIDTDDVIKNAYLTPVFVNMSNDSLRLHVNYNGRQSLITEFRNNLFNIIKAVLLSLIKHK